jgi:Fe-S oxidoreductase
VDPDGKSSVVGLEPPEVYAFKQDYIDLLPDREQEIRQRAARVWLLDEFLLRSEAFDNLRVANTGQLEPSREHSSIESVQFHPHCHQRAEGPSPDGLPNGTAATAELLRACGYDVDVMDTGCCGMAGTFGYEAEHYELSMKVGELKLFPGLRELKKEHPAMTNRQSKIVNRKSVVLSSGAACRMQITHGTGVEAIHPLMLVAGRIKEWTSYDKQE